jgi:asparaginyl-tRNA synthetase
MSESQKDVVPDVVPEQQLEGENPEPLSKAAQKKALKMQQLAEKKAAKAAEKALKDAAESEAKNAAREKAIAEAKAIILTEDASLPAAEKMTVAEAFQSVGKRVAIDMWCTTIRRQGTNLLFIEGRDGTGFPNTIQCVLSGDCAKTYNATILNREATVTLFGTVVEAVLNKQKGGVELKVDYWVLHHASSADIENVYNHKSHPDVLLDQRHLALRESRNVYIMRLRSHIMQCFREHFWSKEFYEVTPPTIVQNQVEGGSTLFKFDYFGSAAYLTQSSQLYLETVVPVLGKVFCCMPSFRAEKHRTRRHLSEYTHFEGEMGFITFDDLLQTLEDMVVDVAERLDKMAGPMIRSINPNFKVPSRPFKRMDYSDAIEWLKEHKIYKDEKEQTFYEFGDDIPELPERTMTDTIGEPIFLCRFPTAMKPFYMYRDPARPHLTESVDLLMPGVGEIIGGSMRTWDLDQLLSGFEKEGIHPASYYWYNDLRKYGSCPHGGWGLGMERYICWILGLDHIRESCLYPRFTGRATP